MDPSRAHIDRLLNAIGLDGRHNFMDNLFHYAGKGNKLQNVIYLLPNRKVRGLLHVACFHQNIEIVEYLIQRGYNLDEYNNIGTRPRDYLTPFYSTVNSGGFVVEKKVLNVRSFNSDRSFKPVVVVPLDIRSLEVV